MNQSILTSIKKMLGIAEDYSYFDDDIIIHINSSISTLRQLGAVVSNSILVSDENQTWSQLIPGDSNEFESIKTFIYLNVRLVFDPPSGAAMVEAYQQLIKELAWRLSVASDSTNKEG